MNQSIFKTLVYSQIKRLIGFVDQDRDSFTFGCADRYYWHYKLQDYYNARFQEGALILAQAYLDFDSEFYNNNKILVIIEGMVDFWFNNLHKNGSVDEIYPHEQSFCATSFTAYIITEVILLLGIKKDYANKLVLVGEWLKRNTRWHISNQVAASAVALYNIGVLTKIDKFKSNARKRVAVLQEEFAKNLYFPEYGGFDLGYNTITMSCLARIYQKTKEKDVLEVLKRAENYISSFIDDKGGFDNQKMSRFTNFIYPYALNLIDSQLLAKLEKGVKADLVLNPAWLDDRYLIGLSNDYLMTCFYK